MVQNLYFTIYILDCQTPIVLHIVPPYESYLQLDTSFVFIIAAK
jgi:hypothetical protein